MAPLFNGLTHTPLRTINNDPIAYFQDNEHVVANYRARADQLKLYDNAKNSLLQEVINTYDYVVTTNQNIFKEREEVHKIRDAFMLQKASLEQNIRLLQDLMVGSCRVCDNPLVDADVHVQNRDPFILCLLDGNEFLFDSILLRDGLVGGERAATALQSALLGWTKKHVSDFSSETKVVVRVYANLKGLVDTCLSAGLAMSLEKMQEFFHGFMLHNTLFDFVDIGNSKGRATQRIIDHFKLQVVDMHCRQIFLASSYDNSFIKLLQNIAKNESKILSRVTLIETTPLPGELIAMQYSKIKLPDILRPFTIPPSTQAALRSNHPVDTGSAHIGLNGASRPFTPRNTTPYTPASLSPYTVASELSTVSRLRSESKASSHLSVPELSATPNRPSGIWAKIAKSSAALPLTDLTQQRPPLTPHTSSVATVIRRNRRNQRLDSPLPYDASALTELKKQKWCNQHYIGAGCCHLAAGKPDKCPHKHDVVLTARQKIHLRVLARETPCKRGTTCDDANCVCGHRCPYPPATEGSMRGIDCLNGEHCRFPREMHGVDLVAVPANARVVGGPA